MDDHKYTPEEWKEIDGYDGRYYISTYGNVRNDKGLILKPCVAMGYLSLKLWKYGTGKPKHQKPHRLVGQAFIPNPHNHPQINHKNGIKTDNHVWNLEWCNNSYNNLHSYRELNRKKAVHKKGFEAEVSKPLRAVSTSGLEERFYGNVTLAVRDGFPSYKHIAWTCRGERAEYNGFVFTYISKEEYLKAVQG